MGTRLSPPIAPGVFYGGFSISPQTPTRVLASKLAPGTTSKEMGPKSLDEEIETPSLESRHVARSEPKLFVGALAPCAALGCNASLKCPGRA